MLQLQTNRPASWGFARGYVQSHSDLYNVPWTGEERARSLMRWVAETGSGVGTTHQQLCMRSCYRSADRAGVQHDASETLISTNNNKMPAMVQDCASTGSHMTQREI
jgi:hypothetical protein